MAKPLVLQHAGVELSFSMTKVDRSKLYGFKEVEVLDENEQKCELATLAGDGHTVVGRGGTAIGYFSPEGLWCDRSELRPVDLEGQVIQPVPSTFDTPVALKTTVTPQEYLDHQIRSVYWLHCEDDASALMQELQQGTIFKFPFSYRGGLEADVAFLLANDEGDVFLAIGNETQAQYLGLQQASAAAEEEEEAGEDEEAMDFDMI